MLLRQAFSNLCRNALEACADAACRAAHRHRRHESMPPQHASRIAVNDNGPGIEPGARGDASSGRSSRPRPDGTGLGLALVQKIIVTHNGRITASNATAGGARLTVSLPLRRA